jgi:hypothetical protein
MTPDGVGFAIAFISFPIAGFLFFRVAYHGREWRLFSKAAATIGVFFFALWLIATAALAISLFSEATTPPRI